MAWETRVRGGSYYTRSRREDGRVVREYVGVGALAEISARVDEAIRAERGRKAEASRALVEGSRELAEMAPDLDEAADALAHAEMVAAGWHRHKGEWRIRRC